MCGNKGASTTSTNAPPQSVQDMYKYLTEQGKSLQQQQYQPYTGQLVAPLNEIQQQGINQVQQYAQSAQPYYQGAAAGTLGAMQGYTPEGFQQGVGGYMSPFLQNALGATAAQLQNVNEQQQQQLLGNAIKTGAFGGDRGSIARAALENQQNLATGQVLGQMAQQGYSDAARNYLAGLQGQGAMANQLGNIGTTAQQQGLAGAGAISQAGSVPYAIQQAQNAANYQQFAQQQAYPFQTLGFLANIASGLGAGQGGTSVTTTPGPSGISQLLGGLTTLGSLMKFADGGAVEEREGHAHGGEASQGGLVPSGFERKPYATDGGTDLTFGTIPYKNDPLYQTMAATAKIPLVNIIPLLEMTKSGKPDVTKAAEYIDQPSEFTKGINAMSEWQKENLRANIQKAIGSSGGLDRSTYETDMTDYSASPDYGSYGPRGLSYSSRGYANRGGLVPRSYHANGEDPEGVTVEAKPKMTLAEHLFGPMSDDARSGLLAAGLGMLSSRSPFPGVAIGEGGMTGLNTYYNAIKNRMEQAKAASEIGLQGAQTEEAKALAAAKPVEVQNAVITNRISALQTLRAIAAGYTASGQPIPSDIQNQINGLASSLMQIAPNLAIAAPKAEGAAITNAPTVTTPSAPATSVPSAPSKPEVIPPATVSTEQPTPAKTEAPKEPEKTEPAKVEDTTEQGNLPRLYDQSFLSQLAPENNPQILRNRAIATAQFDPAGAKSLREEADRVQNELMKNGYGMAPGGKLIKIPGWDQWKTEQENIGANKDYFNKQAQDALARQNSRLQLESIKRIAENFQPNALAEQFADIQRYLKAVGVDVPDSAKMNATAFQSFLKDTLRQVYADVKQFSGGVKVAELEGLEKQMAGPTLEPGTVENIVSQLEGALNFSDKHFNDAVDYRRSHKGTFDQAEFEQKFNKENKLPQYFENARKDVAILGATPKSKSDLMPGKVYVLDRGPDGNPIKPTKKRFVKLSDSGNPIFADVQ